MQGSILALLAAAALPAFAGIHFNGDVNGGRYEPDGSLSFSGQKPLVIGENYKLGKDAGLGLNVTFDVGRFNFGAGGWKADYKENGAPKYAFQFNGVTFNASDVLSNRLDMTQYDAWASYEWDLAKYVPGVSFQTGPMVKATRTTAKTRFVNLTNGATAGDETSDTALSAGGRLHLGFVKDLISVDAQAAFSPGSGHKYREMEARFAVHPMPFFYVGAGWRDTRAEATSGTYDAATGTFTDDRFDIGQKGWQLFLGWRIGMGGR